MCRFALYLGPLLRVDALVTKPVNSIIHQSFHSRLRKEPLNGDGFGLAWYVPEEPEPALFRSIAPAWNNLNLVHLARVTRSTCILAHVRAASPGSPVTETNCHPFTHGPWAFMHNGNVAAWSELRRPLMESLSDEAFSLLEGSTDSEVLFALFVDEVSRAGQPREADRMAAAVDAMVRRVAALSEERGVTEVSHLNVAVTDGRRAVAARWASDAPQAASLYLHTGKAYSCDGGVCRMIAPDTEGGAVLICSEPLSEDPGWERVRENHLVVVHEAHNVVVRPVAL